MMKRFPLKPGVTTRQVNAMIRTSIDTALAEWWALDGIERDEERRRSQGETRYVHGIHTPLRSTLVAIHVSGSGEVAVAFPSNYGGWDRSDAYTRMRVRMYDLIVHDLANRGHIRDTSQPARMVG